MEVLHNLEIESRLLREVAGSETERQMLKWASDRRSAAAKTLSIATGGFDFSSVSNATDDAVMSLLSLDPQFSRNLAADRLYDQFLAQHEPDFPRIAMAMPDGSVPIPVALRQPSLGGSLEQRSIYSAGMWQSLSDGRTFVINRIDQFDRSTLRAFIEALEMWFEYRVSVNCYISRTGAVGFGTHWDDHHVLIMQVVGRKLWEVFAPTHLSAVNGYISKDMCGPPVWSGVLAEGQALLIPRGWSHRVMGMDETSVHYTVTLGGARFLDVLETIAPPPEITDPLAMKAWLSSELDDGSSAVGRTLAFERASTPTRPTGTLTSVANWHERGTPVDDVTVLMPGRPVFVDVPADAGSKVRLAWGGQLVDFSEEEVQALMSWRTDDPRVPQLASCLLESGRARLLGD